MKKTLTLLLLIAFPLTFPTFASDFPSYYPDEGFDRTGRVDAVYPTEGRVVINDIPYQMSKLAIVHSVYEKRVSLARIRPGVRVAFRMGDGRVIEEFWLLPANYDRSRQRSGTH